MWVWCFCLFMYMTCTARRAACAAMRRKKSDVALGLLGCAEGSRRRPWKSQSSPSMRAFDGVSSEVVRVRQFISRNEIARHPAYSCCSLFISRALAARGESQESRSEDSQSHRRSSGRHSSHATADYARLPYQVLAFATHISFINHIQLVHDN